MGPYTAVLHFSMLELCSQLVAARSIPGWRHDTEPARSSPPGEGFALGGVCGVPGRTPPVALRWRSRADGGLPPWCAAMSPPPSSAWPRPALPAKQSGARAQYVSSIMAINVNLSPHFSPDPNANPSQTLIHMPPGAPVGAASCGSAANIRNLPCP